MQVHAEQFLLSNAAGYGESALVRLAVSAAPCGHCRQLYSELACAVGLSHIGMKGTTTLQIHALQHEAMLLWLLGPAILMLASV